MSGSNKAFEYKAIIFNDNHQLPLTFDSSGLRTNPTAHTRGAVAAVISDICQIK
jgi:hypothetical protein